MVAKKEKTMMGDDGGRRDLISELPEPILLHILSFLDMTHVIQTSLLSKKWRYIWASLSILNLDYKVYTTRLFKKRRFPFFVTQVLMFRNHNSNIDLFCVSYRSKNDHTIMNHISTWIHLLIRSNVKVIDFRVAVKHLESLPQFPTYLFTCKSLTTLKLYYGGGHMFNPPAPSSSTTTVSLLPAVKTLHLKALKLLKNPVEMLISSSPVLETLIIDTCYLGDESGEFTISNAQLKSLVIEKSVGRSGDQGPVNVFAPKLESFISKDVFKRINRYAFVNVPSLVHAVIDTNVDNVTAPKNEEKIENVIWCLRGIYNLKSLILSVWLLELVIEVPERLESLQIHPFNNLSYLQLKTSFSKNHARAIMFLLGKCPNLGTLVLKVTEAGSVSVEEEGFWEEAELAPQCNMHHLKLVEIWDVFASVNELEFLKFLLKNATGLEKMVVFTPKGQFPENDTRFNEFGEKLLSFRGASSSVQIVFV